MNSLLRPLRLEPIKKDKNEKARKEKNKQAKTEKKSLNVTLHVAKLISSVTMRMRKLRKMYFALFYILNESQRSEFFWLEIVTRKQREKL